MRQTPVLAPLYRMWGPWRAGKRHGNFVFSEGDHFSHLFIPVEVQKKNKKEEKEKEEKEEKEKERKRKRKKTIINNLSDRGNILGRWKLSAS